jgi:CheY-like chemotaxis protein
MRILLVEDHADTREGLRRLLERAGHRVQAAGSCADALTTAERMELGRSDVIVGDVGLPDGDGLELMQAMKKRHACRAFALTGWDRPDDLDRYKAAGIDRAFIKPVDLTGLLGALESLAAA